MLWSENFRKFSGAGLWWNYLFIKLLSANLLMLNFSADMFLWTILQLWSNDKSKIIIFIKRNLVDWQSIKKIDTFEIFNSRNTLYLFSLYPVGILILHTLNILPSSFSGINNNNRFLFCWKGYRKCCNVFVVFVFTFFKKENIYFQIFLALI